jgi:prevent-host-death family protein
VAEIGVRELKTRASEIVRRLQQDGAPYTITYRGRPVAVLLPLAQVSPPATPPLDPWGELVKLGRAMSEEKATSKDSAEILSEMRR